MKDFIERMRAFLDSLGAEDGSEADETAEVEADATEVEADADEVEAGADKDGDPDMSEVDAENAKAAENADGEDGVTPGTDAEASEAEDDDLRATIREQAAMIETYRNALAAAGLEDPLEVEEDAEAGLDVDDTPSEDDAIAAYEADKLNQQALLASIKE